MSTISPQANRMVRNAADNLLHLAHIYGVVPTIETVPQHPPAMGNYHLRLTLRPARHAAPENADSCRRPDVLESMQYHQGERDDLSLQECMEVLASGWAKVPRRTDRQLVLQITELLAAAPSKPYCYADCQAYAAGIEGELAALRKKVSTYEARDALGLVPPAMPPGKYPPLPDDPAGVCTVDDGPAPGIPGARLEHAEDGYSADQMRAYYDLARAAERRQTREAQS